MIYPSTGVIYQFHHEKKVLELLNLGILKDPTACRTHGPHDAAVLGVRLVLRAVSRKTCARVHRSLAGVLVLEPKRHCPAHHCKRCPRSRCTRPEERLLVYLPDRRGKCGALPIGT
jgi:hypothetical protein